MKAAPALACSNCRRTIGRRAGHFIIDAEAGPVVLCGRCIGSTRQVHASLFPSCPEHWHDLHDHPGVSSATRAGAAAALGLWP